MTPTVQSLPHPRRVFRGEFALCIIEVLNSFAVYLMLYSGAGISFRIREKIVERFRENNINIPYPQRVIHFISSAPETQP